MKISVAMVTYNGARYVREQLASIAAQTRLPDEVIVSDDGSTDGTPDILRDLARELSFPVRVQAGPHVGMRKNVERAIQACSGDLIATADQDDVWRPEKLALSERALSVAPNAGLVFGDGTTVDENLNPLGYTVWESIYFGQRDKRLVREGHAFDLLLRRDVVQGGTMVFRSCFRDLFLPMPSEGIREPDGWIALVVSAVSDLVYLDRSLLLYRQHEGQHMGARHPKSSHRLAKRFLGQLEWNELSVRLTETEWNELDSRLSRATCRYPRAASAAQFAVSDAQHVGARLALPVPLRDRIPAVLREISAGRYRRHSSGMVSATRDVLRSRLA